MSDLPKIILMATLIILAMLVVISSHIVVTKYACELSVKQVKEIE